MEKFDFGKGGMKTKVWGPKLWDSLFMMILGSYPVKINKDNKEHKKTVKVFKTTLLGLGYSLPCSFCRNSFREFSKMVKIDKYLSGRIELARWLYLIKDLVNKKLIEQEKNVKNCKKTIPSPAFLDVLNKYEKCRARCSKKLLRCV